MGGSGPDVDAQLMSITGLVKIDFNYITDAPPFPDMSTSITFAGADLNIVSTGMTGLGDVVDNISPPDHQGIMDSISELSS